MVKKKEIDLDKILELVKKDTKLTIGTLSDQADTNIRRLNSGSVSLDLAMGGGWGLGRMHEVFGNEGGGKSLLALSACAQAQKNGLVAAYIDVENAIEPTWAAKLGVDNSKLLFFQPSSGEEALELGLSLANTKKVSLIVLDSIAALVPQKELEGEMGDVTMGLQARLIGQSCRKLTKSLAQNDVAWIWINQIRQKIGVMYGDNTTTPGGLAVKFFSSIRLKISKESQSDVYNAQKLSVGHFAKVKCIKNKTFPPGREGFVPVNFFHGIDKARDISRALQDTQLAVLDGSRVIVKTPSFDNSFESIDDMDKFLVEFCKDNEKYQNLYKDILEHGLKTTFEPGVL